MHRMIHSRNRIICGERGRELCYRYIYIYIYIYVRVLEHSIINDFLCGTWTSRQHSGKRRGGKQCLFFGTELAITIYICRQFVPPHRLLHRPHPPRHHHPTPSKSIFRGPTCHVISNSKVDQTHQTNRSSVYESTLHTFRLTIHSFFSLGNAKTGPILATKNTHKLPTKASARSISDGVF